MQYLTVRYLPPGPRVEFKNKVGRLVVGDSNFELAASILVDLQAEDVVVTARHLHGRDEILKQVENMKLDPTHPGQLSKKLQLLPGSNVIEVVAAYRNVGPEQGEAESDRQTLEVFFTKKAPAPVFELASLKAVPESAGDATKLEDFKPIVVHSPRVRLEGQIRADDNIVVAEYFRGKDEHGVRLSGFQPDRTKNVEVKEEIRLEPGPQEIRLVAGTTHSDKAERRLTIDYRPMVPAVELLLPEQGPSVSGESATYALTLQGKIQLASDRQPYRLRLLHNDREIAGALKISEDTGSLRAAIELSPGPNRVRIIAENAWGTRTESKEIQVQYVRPPRVSKVTYTKVMGTPAFDLETRVFTATPLKEASIKVENNSQLMPVNKIVLGPLKDGAVPVIAGSACRGRQQTAARSGLRQQRGGRVRKPRLDAGD